MSTVMQEGSSKDLMDETKSEEQVENSMESSEEAKSHEFKIPETTKTYSHLETYPIAASWMRIGNSIPLPHVLRTNLFNLAYSPYIRPITTNVDGFIDRTLDNFETVVPQVKTLRMRDIRNSMTSPIVNSATFIDEHMHNLSLRTNETIRNSTTQARRLYAPVLDTHGRPLIRSQIDPLIKPLNDRLISVINNRYEGIGTPLPNNTNDVEEEDKEYQSEFSHTLSILNNGYSRGRPVLQKRVDGLRELPAQTSKHLNEVYESNKVKRGEGRMIVMIASLDTVRDLMNEGYTFVNEQIQPNNAKKAAVVIEKQKEDATESKD